MESELDRYSREFLDDGKVPNQSSWLLGDKKWLGDRKKAWQEIKKRLVDKNMSHLESDGATPKRKLRIYERYFLKGELPAFDPLSDVPVCLLFLVWWHPVDSDANWQLIKEVIRHIGGEYSRSHYSDSVNMLIENSGSIGFVEADGYPNGFFQGNEERLFNYFINDEVKDKLVAFDPQHPQDKFANNEQAVYRGGLE